MKKQSAGILLYRRKNGIVQVLIGHPGGPFFAKKDDGVWSVPKGLYDNEYPLEAAKREYEEEVGSAAPDKGYIELGEIKRRDGKVIKAWAVKGDLDETKAASNTFEIEWPPRSGKKQEFSEIDKLSWFDLTTAAQKIQPAQVEFLKRLAETLKLNFVPPQQSASAPEQYKLL